MLEVIVVSLLGVAVLIYLYLSHIYSYWHKRGVVQPPITYGFGNIYQQFIMKKHTGVIYDEIYKSYPDHDAVGVYVCLTPKILLRNLDLIKQVCVTEFSSFHDNEFTVNETNEPHVAKDPFLTKGEGWKPQRVKLTSSLTPARVKEVYPLITKIVPRLYTYLDNTITKDVEVKELATLFTMDTVSDTVFGISSDCFTDPDAPFRKFGDMLMKEQLHVWWKALVFSLFPTIRDLIGLKLIPTVVNKYLEEVVQGVLTYRKNNDVTRNDLLQYLLKKESGNIDEIMHHGVTFFIEGFETASMVASNTLYELALNPEVQQKLYEEVKSMYDENEDPDYDTIMNLPYLEKVVQETQRKYPVLFYFTRMCTKPCKLNIDGKQVEIETGTPVLIPVYSIHTDPTYYPNPEVFNPERFNEENKASRPAYTYMPFGEGPRICPGQKFGLVQVKIFVSSIVLKYRILLSEKTPRRMTFAPGSLLLLSPSEDLLVRFEKRK